MQSACVVCVTASTICEIHFLNGRAKSLIQFENCQTGRRKPELFAGKMLNSSGTPHRPPFRLLPTISSQAVKPDLRDLLPGAERNLFSGSC
jgi:hypothetical protein